MSAPLSPFRQRLKDLGDALGQLPPLALLFGVAGLLPQSIALVFVLAAGGLYRADAFALGYGYAALILNFLGGIWWGLAAAQHREPPQWIWFAAITTSLFALGSAVPWMVGDGWPGPYCIALGLALIASPWVDSRLMMAGIMTRPWLALRTLLSITLGMLTILLGLAA